MAWDSPRALRLPHDWPARRRAVLDLAAHRCRIAGPRCIGHATEADHIERGDDLGVGWPGSNLQAACSPCHAEKSAREGGEEWARLRELGRHPPERHPGEL